MKKGKKIYLDQFVNFYCPLIFWQCNFLWSFEGPDKGDAFIVLVHLFLVCAQMFNIWTSWLCNLFMFYQNGRIYQKILFAFVISAPLIHIFLPNRNYICDCYQEEDTSAWALLLWEKVQRSQIILIVNSVWPLMVYVFHNIGLFLPDCSGVTQRV